MKRFAFVLCGLVLALGVGAAETGLKAGDLVAVCGDSITEQQQYSVFIEDYLLMCQPAASLRAIQFGWGGEQASGFSGRMENEVIRFKPTVATTCYGMNDGGYGVLKPDVAVNYTRNTKNIILKFKAAGVRVIVIGSPGCVDSNTYGGGNVGAAVTYNQTLAALGEIDKKLAEENGVVFADVHSPMMDVMAKAKAKYGPKYQFAGGDGVHPGPNGHLVMAYAFLKALGCSGDIGTITVDLAGNKAEATAGHKILSCANGVVEVESSRYPFCFFGAPELPSSTTGVLEFLPFNDELNRFRLIVTNAGNAPVRVTWGAASKDFAAADLAKGINLAAEFLDSPFGAAFRKVESAVKAQQNYEVPLVKSLLHSLPDWQRNVPTEKETLDKLVSVIMQKDKTLFDAAAAAVAPVKHTLKIEAVKP
jgi:lysophospholipase L1-like esterase